MKRTSVVLIAGVAASGCAFNTAPIANPNRLPPDAVALEYVLDRGCLPYVLGRMTEQDAMRGVGLNRIQPIVPGLVPGDGAPYWTGGYAGAPRVNLGGGVCNVGVRGRNLAAYRMATEAALHRTLGTETAADGRAGYRTWVPGQITGCGEAVRYTYYPQPNGKGFSVELTRVSDCARDPQRSAG